MTDRVIVYDGALPQTTDILYTNKFGLVSEAYQHLAILGTNTVVAGLAVTPTTPTASLQVNVAVGAIYQMDPTDAAAYGDLGIDNTNIMKQGILSTPQVLTIVPPSTAGFSQVFLVQAILNDVDGGSLVLSYYNSAVQTNPLAAPFSGPANSGTSNFTTRTCVCAIALKAGVAASTGTQVTPSPDSGFTGLYAITVANGQTQITSTSIARLPTAPYFPTLPQVPYGVQQGTYVYAGQDTGTANNYVITFIAGQPVPTSYVAGMGVKFKALNACSGASVVNVNGLGNVSIRRASGAAVTTGDIVSGQVVELTYDGTNFQMQNYMGAGAGTNTTTIVSVPYIADSGTQNALVGTYSPAITSGQQVAGLFLSIKLANNITGACTINVNGLGAKALKTGDLANPPFNVYLAGEVLLIAYDGTQYQIVNTSSLTYRKPVANTTIFVNTSLGSDTLYDGTAAAISGSSGPFATISKAMTTAFGYAPSQFTITIQVAAGVYNEAVATPAYAGPNVIINGASAGSVLISSGAAHCVSAQGPNTLLTQNVSVQNSGGSSFGGFLATEGAVHTTNNTASNGIPNGGVWYATYGGVCVPGNHTFNGSGASLFFASIGGNIIINAATFTINAGGIAVTSTAVANGGDIVINNVNPPTFVNPSSLSGQRYSSITNGIIYAPGLGVNFLPGNVAGTTSTGGQAIF